MIKKSSISYQFKKYFPLILHEDHGLTLSLFITGFGTISYNLTGYQLSRIPNFKTRPMFPMPVGLPRAIVPATLSCS